MRIVFVFLSGLLFSAGLVVSGMINPAKVIGFLDLFGDWDASLAFVMAGAVAVNLVGHRVVTHRAQPLFADGFSLPTRTDIDRDLILGASLFGVGWGLVGLCPGPAIAALGAAPMSVSIFVIAMLLGMILGRLIKARRTPAPA
ncbi:MAG: DUF6691 family protein [Pseudomonadota bacterium]